MSLSLWIFLIIFFFCIYVLFGLYITEDIKLLSSLILTWVVYTILWITFVNIIVLAYFWQSVKNKRGPTGIRGPSGENGKQGIEGSCSISASQVYLIKILSEYIDELYTGKSGKSILNTTTMKFPNIYLTNKISTQASSRQYNVIVANLSNQNKSISDIVNYLKDIWKIWFDLIYAGNSDWFEDEYGDENYSWTNFTNNNNPFDEIRKYDVYYWGLTRTFRPLKAEICRSNLGYTSSKIPQKVRGPRLKIIETNDYNYIGDDYKTGGSPDNSWWRPKIKNVGGQTYYPVGDIITAGGRNVWYGQFDKPKTVVGDFEMSNPIQDRGNGPSMKTILITGDVKNAIAGDSDDQLYTGGQNRLVMGNLKCPDEYMGLGTTLYYGRNGASDSRGDLKCIPRECVEEITNSSKKQVWMNRDGQPLYVLSDWMDNQNPTSQNSYNLFKSGKLRENKFYKIKEECLIDNTDSRNETKELEPEFDRLGFGWYGHPYKLEGKYSIFSFLGLVPEGMIVHQSTGRRFYIVHYGGEDVNLYIVIDYNKKDDQFNKALQVNENKINAEIITQDIARTNPRQQWIINLVENDKSLLKLKNVYNERYLYIGLEPIQGMSQFSTIDLDYNNYKKNSIYSDMNDEYIKEATTFSFISTYGTNLNIIDEQPIESGYLIGTRVRITSQQNQKLVLFGVIIYGKDGTIINSNDNYAKQSSVYRITHNEKCAIKIINENTSRNINDALQSVVPNNKEIGWNTYRKSGSYSSITNGDRTGMNGGDWWEYKFINPIEIMAIEVFLHDDDSNLTSAGGLSGSIKQRNQNMGFELYNDDKYPDDPIWIANTGLDIPKNAQLFYRITKNGTIKHND